MPVEIRSQRPVDERLMDLAQAAQHDLACACGPQQPRRRGDNGLWIYPAALPSGGRASMLKVLQASGCERACAYCTERLGGSGRRAGLAPEELARAFVELHRQGRVFGLFLSSAIQRGPVATMDRMLATCELLRTRYRYRGYLHLKIIPGSEPAQVERATALATRVSINMEAPTALHLSRIAPGKRLDDQILAPMRQVARAQADGSFRRGGQTTQFVVGAAGETDRDITGATAWLYEEMRLARVYYSALQAAPGTPLAHRPPVPFLREHRLYQADFLLRRYGFALDEISFNEDGFLPLDVDPKTVWARRHAERFPVEVNTASETELLRVPGIGPGSAKRLIAMRRGERLRSVAALRAAGASWRVAAPYLLLAGKRIPSQLSLFS
jgi:predicted DNA-binding helix-hairpin-helix protein